MTDMATHDPGDNPAVPAINVPINASFAVKKSKALFISQLLLSLNRRQYKIVRTNKNGWIKFNLDLIKMKATI